MIGQTYHLRWEIEELYKTMKSDYFTQRQFHAKSAEGVEQEVRSQLLMVAIARLLSCAARIIIVTNSREEQRKSDKQVRAVHSAALALGFKPEGPFTTEQAADIVSHVMHGALPGKRDQPVNVLDPQFDGFELRATFKASYGHVVGMLGSPNAWPEVWSLFSWHVRCGESDFLVYDRLGDVAGPTLNSVDWSVATKLELPQATLGEFIRRLAPSGGQCHLLVRPEPPEKAPGADEEPPRIPF